jgi:hypothetical protein
LRSLRSLRFYGFCFDRRERKERRKYERHVAYRCTAPPFALGTDALEFSPFDKSGLGGR